MFIPLEGVWVEKRCSETANVVLFLREGLHFHFLLATKQALPHFLISLTEVTVSIHVFRLCFGVGTDMD